VHFYVNLIDSQLTCSSILNYSMVKQLAYKRRRTIESMKLKTSDFQTAEEFTQCSFRCSLIGNGDKPPAMPVVLRALQNAFILEFIKDKGDLGFVMAGIKDVAEKAGVSVTTVSRVLNKRGYISQEMYQRVNQAIEELNYYPNQIARYLYWQRTFVIGLLIPDVSRPFFACLAKYIEMELSSRGYKMLLCNTEEKANKERECLAMLRQNKVDGIVIGSHALDTSEYRKVVLPMVSIDMKLGDQIPNVSSNHRRGGELAARKLIENGCKNVVQIMSDRRIKTNSQERHKAFQRLMEENGIKCTTYELKKQGSICEEYAKAEKKIFSVASGVDGAFAIDYIAARILRAALSRGIRVPQELKIVGYDGTEIAELVYPRLTTVCQNYAALSQSIVSSLVYQIEQKERPEVDPIHDVVLFEGGTTLA